MSWINKCYETVDTFKFEYPIKSVEVYIDFVVNLQIRRVIYRQYDHRYHIFRHKCYLNKVMNVLHGTH